MRNVVISDNFATETTERVAEFADANLWQTPAPGLEDLTVSQARAVRDLVLRAAGVAIAPLFEINLTERKLTFGWNGRHG